MSVSKFPRQNLIALPSFNRIWSYFQFIREQEFYGIPATPLQLILGMINRTVKGHVYSGPFAGLQYVPESIMSAHYPKLLGTYELELHPIIEKLCQTDFEKIINVGAGEGYYSIGFATRNKQAKIVAFEPGTQGRKLIKEMARLNGVEKQLDLQGLCDITSFQDALNDSLKYLVIMDCEGSESILLDPRNFPNLKTATIVVEMHTSNVPGLDEIIISRFQDTHNIAEIWTRDRTVKDFPFKLPTWVYLLFKNTLLNIMYENRGKSMCFFYLEPKIYNQS
ncbi:MULTISPECIES: hypothetical protein [Calothrix]|uniref:Methyltransferase FkbM domain-containing protein n=2 Tax=Calothrix TaxID=1186 RepID=A0ABR8AC83_9CYAN|nr:MULTISPECIES: hypothetical protein [Calothrix]MBD2197627.1 hypothetical protein [Calothrix parietina FACHB-288]MBD2227417.1 hypothetical protein [Calothrix anomala FACHB-343]